MKNITKIFAIALVVIASSAAAFAQSSITASTTATLVTPISISKTTDMNFGTVASSATDGTIIMSAAGTVTKGAGGASVISGATTAAVFHVVGSATESFSVSYPTSVILASPSGSLTVDNIAADCGSSTNLVGGVKDIHFSAILNIPANTVADTYTNASSLLVTVNYN